MTQLSLVPPLAACLLLLGCGESKVILDQPRGRIEGVVLLDQDVAPPCVDGVPTGQVVFELFLEAVLPEPMGPAADPVHVAVIPAREVFGTTDCGADPPRLRSGPFALPGVGPEPGAAEGETFVLRAMYDVDGDYDPARRITQTPSRGDAIGGAITDAPSAAFVPIPFDPPEAHPRGQTVTGVTVTLRTTVDTEVPVSRLGALPMSSEAIIPVTSDAIERERMMFALTDARLYSLLPAHAGELAAAGLSYDVDPLANAWLVRELDADRDGGVDFHPLLGADGISWFTPTVVLERRRTAAERDAGVPRVETVTSVRPTQILIKRVFSPVVDQLIAPIFVMLLDPADPTCHVPLLAPGNVTNLLERVPTDCQELPTGPYDARVYHGQAGAQRATAPSILSDVGEDLIGGEVPALWMQRWPLPNDLPIVGQGDTFWVFDPDPSTRPDPTDPSAGHGVAACKRALDPSIGVERDVSYQPVPGPCCAPVRHLCGLPLCEPRFADGRAFRALEALAPDGTAPCVPFAMPASCCAG